jgi:tetratricopeptide (TPR) repeat protein
VTTSRQSAVPATNEQDLRREFVRAVRAPLAEQRARLERLQVSARRQRLSLWWRLLEMRRALLDGQLDLAVARATGLIKNARCSPEIRYWALLSRGIASCQKEDADKAIADFSAVIEDPRATLEVRLVALISRGIARGRTAAHDMAIADFSAVIQDPEAPAEECVDALVDRGAAWGRKGDYDRALADFSAVIEDPRAPPDRRLGALVNRGLAWDRKGDQDKAIRDFSAVIAEPGVPSELLFTALTSRGSAWRRKGDLDNAIAGFSAAIDHAGAPPRGRLDALLRRGIALHRKGELDKAIADFSVLIDSPGTPPAVRIRALLKRGIAWDHRGDLQRAIADFSAVVEDQGAPPERRFDALVHRGIAWDHSGDPEKATADFSAVSKDPGAPPMSQLNGPPERGIDWDRQGIPDNGTADSSAVVKDAEALRGEPGTEAVRTDDGLSQRIGRCIYCGRSDGALSREHVIPAGLNGTWVLAEASCRSCAEVTGRLEQHILRVAFRDVRAALGMRTRRPRERPEALPLTLRTSRGPRTIRLRPSERPTFLALPVFASPRYLVGQPPRPGSTLIDLCLRSVAGPTIAELNRRYGEGVWGTRIAYQPSLFGRFLGKIAYCAAVATVGLDTLEDVYILSTVMGREDMTGHWVGSRQSRRFSRSAGLHAVGVEVHDRDLLAHIALFEPFDTPEYVVVVGRLKDGIRPKLGQAATVAGQIDSRSVLGGE